MNRENAARSLLQLTAHLIALRTTYHALHVSASGPDFYSDHLLFQRLYEDEHLSNAIDRLMERAQLLDPQRVFDPQQILREAASLIPTIAHAAPAARAKEVISLETSFQSRVNGILEDLQSPGMELPIARLLPGIENLLQDIADQRQQNLYLLQRRFIG